MTKARTERMNPGTPVEYHGVMLALSKAKAMEIPDKDAAKAARRLTRLLLLAMLGERLYEQEIGTGGDDRALLADLAWAADYYASKATAQVAEPEPTPEPTEDGTKGKGAQVRQLRRVGTTGGSA